MRGGIPVGATLTLLLAACGSSASAPRDPTPAVAAPVAMLPDVAVGMLAARAVGCMTTCCLPQYYWFDLARASASVARYPEPARDILTSTTDPTARPVALRNFGENMTFEDRALVVPLLDDTRYAGELPTFPPVVLYGECQPLSWTGTTVRDEALFALSRLHSVRFDTPDAYRAWAANHPNLQPTFDHWYSLLRGSSMDERLSMLQRLKAVDPVMVVRITITYCREEQHCGRPAAVHELLRGTLDAGRALRWLTREESWPEWNDPYGHYRAVHILLEHGELFFSDADVPALLALAPRLEGANRARLAVLTSRLRPRDAGSMWTEALAQLDGDKHADDGHSLILEEAASREPATFGGELVRWFDRGYGEAILTGLARSGPVGRATLAKLVKRPKLTAESPKVGVALAKAAQAQGCKGFGHPETMRYWPAKGESEKQRAEGEARARRDREALLRLVRTCLR
jgi:hypothetical protein